MIPYVELLAYYVDYYGLPQWVNYLPSLLILLIVFFSMLGSEAEKDATQEEESKKDP